MSTYNSRPELDEELAAMTDRLLEGQDQPVSPENEALAKVVKKLYGTIGPAASSGADPTFRAHLTQRLNEEWEAVGRHPQQSNRFMQPRTLRMLSAAAAMTLVLFFVLIILGQGGGGLTGTAGPNASGSNNVVTTVIFVAALAIAAGAVWWFRRR